MEKKIELSIPTPCHEKWDSFKPTARGGFCGSCHKEVIDFTQWEEERIKTYFKNRPSNTCGWFQQKQLKVYTVEQPINRWPAWIPTMAISTLLIFSSRQVNAQVKGKVKPDTIQQDQQQILFGDTISIAPLHIKVKGIVLSVDDQLPMPGVNVMRRGTVQSTVTDVDGRFTMEIKKVSPTERLIFSFIGMEDMEKEINTHQSESEMTVMLNVDVKALNEMIVVGGLVSTRWYNPRGWWWRVRGLFKRY